MIYTGPDCECERWRDGAVWCLVHGVARPLAWQPSYTADAIQVDDADPEMFTTEWRMARVREGDKWLEKATKRIPGTAGVPAAECIAIAQAHYQAANIRSRPGESARKDRL